MYEQLLDNEHFVVSELLLMLLGEQCVYTDIAVHDNMFAVKTDAYHRVPNKLVHKLDKIALLSTNVRQIEKWRNTAKTVDSIKRAIFETLSSIYKKKYVDVVVKIRESHIASNPTTIEEIVHFVSIWQDKIGFMAWLIKKITGNQPSLFKWNLKSQEGSDLNGIEAMNLVFVERSLQPIVDWSYKMLDDVLRAASTALNHVVFAWLLDGEPSLDIPWFIAREDNAQNDSIESNVNRNRINSDSNIFIEAKIIIHLIPCALKSSPDLVEKILEIGKMSYFFKYGDGSNEELLKIKKQIESLEEFQALKPELAWQDFRQRSQLCALLSKIHEIVTCKTMKELSEKQRITDHLLLLNSYFFLLRSDFITGIQDSLIYDPGTPNSSRKLQAEKHIKNALCSLKPPIGTADLSTFLRVSKKSKNINDNRCSRTNNYTEDLFELYQLTYKPPKPVPSIFSPSLDIYRRIFSVVAPQLLLLFHLNRFSAKLRSFTSLFNQAQIQQTLMRRIHLKLFNIRCFLNQLLSYIFINVLEFESGEIFEDVKNINNFDQFRLTLERHMKRIAARLYQRNSAAVKRDQLAQCKTQIRSTLSIVEKFVDRVERITNEDQIINLIEENGAIETTLAELNEISLDPLNEFDFQAH